MKRDIREKKERLYKESLLLRLEASNTGDYDKSMELRKRQDKLYKKWLFYCNVITEMDKKDKEEL